eukprot:scaffold111178_cov50-Cyclotella_meneghiniana.AAC.2
MRHWKDSRDREIRGTGGGGSMAPTVWIYDLPSSQGFGVASASGESGVSRNLVEGSRRLEVVVKMVAAHSLGRNRLLLLAMTE